MALFKRKNQHDDDLGFGTKPVGHNQRMLNANGTTNVRRTGRAFFNTFDQYNALITMSWRKFLFIIVSVYVLVNILFATLYVSIGIEHLNGTTGVTPRDHFFDAFFFSAQTISTVGYGHISPSGFATSIVAAFESMLGLLAFALATGLLYGRFSRPTAKITYSQNILVAPYRKGKGLMFRFANLRSNQLLEINVQVIMAYNETENGETKRRFQPLDLERKRISLLTLSWTVVHEIDEKSPLFEKTKEEFSEAEVEILVLVNAFDDTFSQTVHSRTSYQDEDIVWDAKFQPVYHSDGNGQTVLNLAKINAYEVLN